ncbi:MAG: tetratricopeptide repeat protein [Campylobacterota bacterium]|nr:tetratricopeptide repeat protein [Campylobacterota bacterium]
MKNKYILFYLLLFLLFTANTIGNNYEENLKKIEMKAKNGDSYSQYVMGIVHQNGLGYEKNLTKAFEYFSKSEKGYSLARYPLAEMYYWGEGIEQNYTKASDLYVRIFVGEDINSIIKSKIAHMYLFGEGVDKNLTKAVELYQESADENYVPALYNLGIIYYNGIGVDKNLTKARVCLQRASNNNHFQAQYYLAELLDKKDTNKYKKEVLKLLTKSAIGKFDKAQLILGNGYIRGDDVEKDMKKAKYWIQKAKDQNNTKAQELWKKYELWKY